MTKNLIGHTLVCGFGRNGRQAVKRLQQHKEQYIVIEQDEKLIKAHEKEILFYKGTALSDEVLLAAGIQRAKNLICSLPDDADNLFVVFLPENYNPILSLSAEFQKNETNLNWNGLVPIM